MFENGVWVAEMDSERFSWMAVGRTKEEAIQSVVREWNHGIGCENRVPMTEEELIDNYGLGAMFYEFGKCEWC